MSPLGLLSIFAILSVIEPSIPFRFRKPYHRTSSYRCFNLLSCHRRPLQLHLSAYDDVSRGNSAIATSNTDEAQNVPSYELSLRTGNWVKFICGASNTDVSMIRNLCLIYTLAGVDCIDLSADVAVLTAADEGILAALKIGESLQRYSLRNRRFQRPIKMISVNDHEDPHFRKAHFDPSLCPRDCPRPCEKVCPAWAIPSIADNPAHILSRENKKTNDQQTSIPPVFSGQVELIVNEGVISDRCYGCGRCVPVCPLGLIETASYVVRPADIRAIFSLGLAEAIEIHTLPNHSRQFDNLWKEIGAVVLQSARVIAVSFPSMDSETIPYINGLQGIIEGSLHINDSAIDSYSKAHHNGDISLLRDSWKSFSGVQIWQTDGRPMSGDIGKGTARAANELARSVLTELLDRREGKEEGAVISRIMDGKEHSGAVEQKDSCGNLKEKIRIDIEGRKHFVQVAGGTNDYSVVLAREDGSKCLAEMRGFGGFAFGGYARKAIGKLLRQLEDNDPGGRIEDNPLLLSTCLNFADELVQAVKNSTSARGATALT